MPETFGELLDNLNGMDLEEISKRALDETVDRIADLNREQLKAGFTSTGNRLRPYRSKNYAAVKNLMNPLPGLGNPDFLVTGAFHAKIQAERFGDNIGVHSYDQKAEDLEARDGADNIYGLTEDNHSKYVEEDLSPVYYREVRESLKL